MYILAMVRTVHFFVWILNFSFGLFLGSYFLKFCWCILGEQHQQKLPSSKVDSEISAATNYQQQQSPGFVVDLEIPALMKDSNKLLINDSYFNSWMETIINAGFKSNDTCLWSNHGFFKSISCDFHVEKSNVPEMTILCINQVYFKDKYGKKIYCCNLFVIGQATPMLNPPEDLENYVP